MYDKINIGSGNKPGDCYKHKGWIKFDMIRGNNITIRGDMLMLPFKDSVFKEIHCIHTLEHLTRDKHLPALKEMNRVLAKGGKCYVEVPDFKQTVAKLHEAFEIENLSDIHIWTTSVYGKTERPGMAHHFGFYDQKLIDLFKEAGFKAKVETEMISNHYLLEPVLLVSGEK
jgi:predicted SAM-dependent methyltransferase